MEWNSNPLVLRDSYNYTFSDPESKSVPAYVLHQLRKHFAEKTNEEAKSVGITNGATGVKAVYSDFDRLSRNVASGLYKQGFRKGDTLIYTTDQVELLHVFLLGAWRANGIIRGSYPEDYGEPLQRRLEESSARFILCDEDNLDKVLLTIENVPWEITVIVYGNPGKCISAQTFFKDDGNTCPAVDVNGDDVAVVMPTSGTTGRSKGVMLTHERLIKNFQVTKGYYCQADPEQRFLHLGKATHVTSVQMFGFIAAAQSVVRLPLKGISPTVIFKAIEAYKPYGMNIIGPFMLKLVNDPNINSYDLTSLKWIGLMGTVIGPKMVEAIKKFPGTAHVTNIYGSTETLNLSYGMKFSAGKRLTFEFWELPPLATGKLAPSCSLAVIDTTGTIVGPRVPGELWFKSAYSCTGYLNNPVATSSTFDNGWIRTGDYGYYDDDGLVYVVSRLKEVFHHFGNQVSPSEIEDVLVAHPLVEAACVVPVEDPNGGDLMAKGFVVLKGGKSSWSNETVKELIEFANSKLQDYKHLKGGLELVEGFEYGPGGKVRRPVA